MAHAIRRQVIPPCHLKDQLVGPFWADKRESPAREHNRGSGLGGKRPARDEVSGTYGLDCGLHSDEAPMPDYRAGDLDILLAWPRVELNH